MRRQQSWFISIMVLLVAAIWVFVIIYTGSFWQTVPLSTKELEEKCSCQCRHIGRFVRLPEEPEEGQVEEPGTSELIDLRSYDFSDIATPEGVPIDGILERLGLDEPSK